MNVLCWIIDELMTSTLNLSFCQVSTHLGRDKSVYKFFIHSSYYPYPPSIYIFHLGRLIQAWGGMTNKLIIISPIKFIDKRFLASLLYFIKQPLLTTAIVKQYVESLLLMGTCASPNHHSSKQQIESLLLMGTCASPNHHSSKQQIESLLLMNTCSSNLFSKQKSVIPNIINTLCRSSVLHCHSVGDVAI